METLKGPQKNYFKQGDASHFLLAAIITVTLKEGAKEKSTANGMRAKVGNPAVSGSQLTTSIPPAKCALLSSS